MGKTRDQQDERTVVEREQKTKRPHPWNVILHNDDYTTMDFVIEVLIKHFHKTHAEATYVMLQIHHKGKGVAGRYPRDVAETKAKIVTEEARANQMPLKATAEPS